MRLDLNVLRSFLFWLVAVFRLASAWGKWRWGSFSGFSTNSYARGVLKLSRGITNDSHTSHTFTKTGEKLTREFTGNCHE